MQEDGGAAVVGVLTLFLNTQSPSTGSPLNHLFYSSTLTGQLLGEERVCHPTFFLWNTFYEVCL